jgi:hypothetical protein
MVDSHKPVVPIKKKGLSMNDRESVAPGSVKEKE